MENLLELLSYRNEMADWIPTERQSEALVQTVFEVLYGGARGGGKTDAGMAWLLYDIEHPRYRALVVRRNAEDLSDWVDRAEVFFRRNGAKKVGNPARFIFPSGAVIRTGHLKDQNAYMKYQGHEYHRILIEELTQIPREKDYLMLISSCRSTVPGLRAQVFATTNPGNAGHDWVKERWGIDENSSGRIIVDAKTTRKRVFISAKVDDNPYLTDNDPEYVAFLDGLPDGLRQQWREGSWEDVMIEGAYWAKQMRELQARGRIGKLHFDPLLPVHTFWDIGWNDSNAIWFVQIIGQEIRLIDYYYDDHKSLKEYTSMLYDRSRELGYKYGTHFFPHDFAVHEWSDGKTRHEKFESYLQTYFHVQAQQGIHWDIVPKTEDLQNSIDEARDILPYCIFDAEKCKEGIRALKNYRNEYLAKKNTFKDTPDHDWSSHGASAFMQMCMTVNIKYKISPKKQKWKETTDYVTGEVRKVKVG